MYKVLAYYIVSFLIKRSSYLKLLIKLINLIKLIKLIKLKVVYNLVGIKAIVKILFIF